MMGPAGSNLKISGLGQDFFALEKSYYANNGFFVDIGAADGFTASNTFLLEKFYNWAGICIDPNPVFLQSLYNCRNSCVSNLCAYSETGIILPFQFYDDTAGFYGWNLRAGLKYHLSEIDEKIMKSFREINVLTVSLNDLLLLYQAPFEINYISLDTEGSEYEILKTFDFSKYDVRCLTIEYSNQNQKRDIENLLIEKNYSCFDCDSSEIWATKND